MIKQRNRRLILLVALLLLLIAFFWNFSLNRSGAAAQLTRYLNSSFGYRLLATDLYAVDDWPDTSIRLLLPEDDLGAAVLASKESGFPSDIDRVGVVTMVVANTMEGEVITLFLVDQEIELGFSQQAGVDDVYALGAVGP